ncbi:macrophage colony-stimulating factor 1 receptor 2-like isoform X2 [Paramacrobiotus metropolitanus]|uniref:macrophage colony-stimulating factor 1 receptor 2-like isoform X2 n=1 Tax=Paramacrobiotus metropolitanus TaxID=2943436 RepID=UPI0024463752|nr:macrophage colony-stimulating factor 1 receptor 2-like isoform X2 [Paramacrobiotus metropolitanus]
MVLRYAFIILWPHICTIWCLPAAWPHNTVPFEFSIFFDQSQKEHILAYMEIISRASEGCVKFVKRTTQKDFIFLKPASPDSWLRWTVGRQGGQQDVGFENDCLWKPACVQRELMHVLGFYNEPQRFDRDYYVMINPGNIVATKQDQFRRVPPDEMETYGLSYDYHSVMQLASTDYAINPFAPTIYITVSGTKLSPNDQLSSLDAVRLQRRCVAGSASSSSISPGSPSISSTTTSSAVDTTSTTGSFPKIAQIVSIETSTGNSTNHTATALALTSSRNTIIVRACLGAIIPAAAIAVVICLVVIYRKRRLSQNSMRKIFTITIRRRKSAVSPIIPLHDLSAVQCDILQLDPVVLQHIELLEIPLANLEITEKILGKGANGIVRKGVAKCLHGQPDVTEVAMKTAKNRSDSGQFRQLVQELRIMADAGRHLNIVNLLGVVMKGEMMLLMEYARFGSLLTYLRAQDRAYYYNHTASDGRLLPYSDEEAGRLQKTAEAQCQSRSEDTQKQILSTNALLKLAYQSSRGLEYLSSRSIIHRDVAARNVLICDGLVAKIADFGLAKHEKQDGPRDLQEVLPVRWMSPEAIGERTFSTKSDVWSFGVLLWEMFTLGEVPYADVEIIRKHIPEFLLSLRTGLRLKQSVFCPTLIYALMTDCWKLLPDDRTDFVRLTEDLRSIIDADSAEHYLLLDDIYAQYNATYLNLLSKTTKTINRHDVVANRKDGGPDPKRGITL